MPATNYTPIILYHSTTASAAPVAGNLNNGELAINITDGKLYYKDNGGNVQVLATQGTGTIGGSNTQVQYNSSGSLAGSSNLTFDGTTLTANQLALTTVLDETYGGTGLNAYTTGDLIYASGSNTLGKLSIGTNTYILTSTGSVPQWSAPSSVTVATANNLAGGAAGSVPYQTGSGVTTFLSIGTQNQVVTSTGTAPQWSSSLTLVDLIVNGNTTLGDAAADTVTVNGTVTSNLIFTDNTYDIGASGATRPRNLYLAGDATIGGSIAATTLDLTNLEVTNIKAKDGTASITIADSTGAVSFANNVTLGDASTDTVTVNGYMGVGGAPLSSAGVYIRPTSLLGVSVYGARFSVAGTSSNTTSVQSIYSAVETAAGSYTVTNVNGARFADAVLGSGVTITYQRGLYVEDQSRGTYNYGFESVVSSGTNKWNIYASGTAKNLFAGQVVLTSNTTTEGSLYLQSTSPVIGFTDTNSFTDPNDVVLVRAGTNNYQVQYYDSSATTTYDLQTMSLTETVFNDSSQDINFRVESDTNTHAIFLDAANSRVGINNSSPTVALDITGDLKTSGNTTLGDASTDTVTVNGYMAIGGSPYSGIAAYIRTSGLQQASQVAIQSSLVGNSTGTSALYGLLVANSTEAAAFNVGSVYNIRSNNVTLGAGSSATNQYGMYIADLTSATNNYGITSLVSSGTNKWNIYANGTAANYFAGNVLVGTTTAYGWANNFNPVIRLGAGGYVSGRTPSANYDEVYVGTNAYNDGAWKYAVDGFAMQYYQDAGQHVFRTAASGTANAAITFNERFAVNQGEAVFNDPGNDYDFRVESDTNTHMLFVDASTNRVGIANNTPLQPLDVTGNIGLQNVSGATYVSNIDYPIMFSSEATGSIGFNGHLVLQPRGSAAGKVILAAGQGAAAMKGRVQVGPTETVVNEDSDDYDFRVESDTNTHALFVDAGNSYVGVNTNAPRNVLDVDVGTNASFLVLQANRANAGTTSSLNTQLFTISVPYSNGGAGVGGSMRVFVNASAESGLNACANRSAVFDIVISRTGANSGGGNTDVDVQITELTNATSSIGAPTISDIGLTASNPAASAATQTVDINITGTSSGSYIWRVYATIQYIGWETITFSNLT